MHSEAKPPLTDSPWFWLALFSSVALVGLVLMHGKYGHRQATIERQFQARSRQMDAFEQQRAEGAGEARPPSEAPRPYSQPGENLIPLWPLAIPLAGMCGFALWMILKARKP